MQNFVKDGTTIKYTNSTGSTINSGDPVRLSSGKVCVAMGIILDGATGLLKTTGVYIWPKATPLTIAQGDKLYWDGTKVTKTVTDNFVGQAHEAAASADVTVLVDIDDSEGGTQMPNIALIATADGSDAGTTQTLANATKAKVNAIITALIASGAMAGD